MAQAWHAHILDDEPVTEDAFGSHKRIALALKTLVESEKGGKAIALTGTWGSGKSTVVRILQRLINEGGELVQETPEAAVDETTKKEIRVFVYDAWAHQGDSLRRAFIETLFDFLTGKQCQAGRAWIEDKKSEDELRERVSQLSRRQDTSQSTSSPVLTRLGKALALSLIAVPVGCALLAGWAGRAGSSWWIFGFAIFLVAVPVLICGIAWAAGLRRRAQGEDDAALVFLHHTRTKTETETVRTPDPTSLEFRSLFRRLMGAALGQKNRRLVMVVDNLDRIPAEEALSAWATIRTFFDPAGETSEEWEDRLWLVVPFDRSSLRRLWADQAGDEPARAQFAESFLEKTFQVEFRVPPPLLSSWREFLIERLREALPNLKSDHQLEQVYQLYRAWRSTLKTPPPTPRDIKLFANSLAALHALWGDEIPLEMQALYVLYNDEVASSVEALRLIGAGRRSGRGGAVDLLQGKIGNERVQHLVSSTDWPKYLVALHYNRPPREAIEILLAPSFERAFGNADCAELVNVSSIPGFEVACADFLQDYCLEAVPGRASRLATAAVALDGAEKAGVKCPACWALLIRFARDVKSWDHLDKRIGQGTACIVRRAKDVDLAKSLVRSLVASCSKLAKQDSPAGSDERVKVLNMWVDACVQVLAELEAPELRRVAEEAFRVPVVDYVACVARTKATGVSPCVVRYFLPRGRLQDVTGYLAKLCSGGAFRKTEADAIQAMLNIEADWQWDNFLREAGKRLQNGQVRDAEELEALTRALLALGWTSGLEKARALLRGAVRGGLFALVPQADSPARQQALVNCFLAALLVLKSKDLNGLQGEAARRAREYRSFLANPEQKQERVDALASMALELKVVDDLLTRAAEDHEIRKAVATVLRTMAAEEQDYVVNELMQHAFAEELAPIYLELLEATNSASLKSFVVRGLQNTRKERWLQELKTEGALIDLALRVRDHANLKDAMHDALREHAGLVLSGEVTHEENTSRNWRPLSQCLTQDWTQRLPASLWRKVLESPDAPLKSLLYMHGDDLLRAAPPKEKADEFVEVLVAEIVQRRDREELTWLLEAARREQFQEVLQAANLQVKSTLRDRIKSAISEQQDDAIKALLTELLQLLGLGPEEAPGGAGEEAES